MQEEALASDRIEVEDSHSAIEYYYQTRLDRRPAGSTRH